MGPVDFLLHLLGLLAPALGVAAGVSLAARLLMPASPGGGWWLPLAVNFATGAAVLLGGLWYFGRDGKMATYAALVAAVASSQWLLARAWRR
jgi:hypothetical protein